MQLSIERVREHAYRAITERGYQPKSWWISDCANSYGEPGYGSYVAAGTQLVLLGSWWIRGDDGELSSIDRRYPRLCNALEELGVEAFEGEHPDVIGALVDTFASQHQPAARGKTREQ